ncbi:hypothetical protein [Antrihabitans spumae]|jgi:hypothetical protein|uniref:Uncharacterized protein n=1 Tax=Antrihabitans spumae TaxID=3373370 RepID=A0ABW7KA24_9NOCA
MGMYGEIFGSSKLRKESGEDAGTGEETEWGALDLDRGVVYLDRRGPAVGADDADE